MGSGCSGRRQRSSEKEDVYHRSEWFKFSKPECLALLPADCEPLHRRTVDELVSHYKGRLTVRNGLPRRHKGKPFIVMCFSTSDNVEEDVVKVLSKLGLNDGTDLSLCLLVILHRRSAKEQITENDMAISFKEKKQFKQVIECFYEDERSTPVDYNVDTLRGIEIHLSLE